MSEMQYSVSERIKRERALEDLIDYLDTFSSELKCKNDVTKKKRNNRHGDIPWQVKHSVVILKKCFDKHLCVANINAQSFRSLVPVDVRSEQDGFSYPLLATSALLNYFGVQIPYSVVRTICYH